MQIVQMPGGRGRRRISDHVICCTDRSTKLSSSRYAEKTRTVGPPPTFFKSRIYIDLSDDSDFARGFEQLLRWCFDKPLYVEPELGEPPSFLDEQAAPVVASALTFQRVIRDPAIPPQAVVNTAVSFLREISESTVSFPVELEEPHDEAIFSAIRTCTGAVPSLMSVVERAVQVDARN